MQFYCDINITSKSIVYNLYNFEKIKGIFYSAALIKSHQLGDLQKKKKKTVPTVLEARKPKTEIFVPSFSGNDPSIQSNTFWGVLYKGTGT